MFNYSAIRAQYGKVISTTTIIDDDPYEGMLYFARCSINQTGFFLYRTSMRNVKLQKINKDGSLAESASFTQSGNDGVPSLSISADGKTVTVLYIVSFPDDPDLKLRRKVYLTDDLSAVSLPTNVRGCEKISNYQKNHIETQNGNFYFIANYTKLYELNNALVGKEITDNVMSFAISPADGTLYTLTTSGFIVKHTLIDNSWSGVYIAGFGQAYEIIISKTGRLYGLLVNGNFKALASIDLANLEDRKHITLDTDADYSGLTIDNQGNIWIKKTGAAGLTAMLIKADLSEKIEMFDLYYVGGVSDSFGYIHKNITQSKKCNQNLGGISGSIN